MQIFAVRNATNVLVAAFPERLTRVEPNLFGCAELLSSCLSPCERKGFVWKKEICCCFLKLRSASESDRDLRLSRPIEASNERD